MVNLCCISFCRLGRKGEFILNSKPSDATPQRRDTIVPIQNGFNQPQLTVIPDRGNEPRSSSQFEYEEYNNRNHSMVTLPGILAKTYPGDFPSSLAATPENDERDATISEMVMCTETAQEGPRIGVIAQPTGPSKQPLQEIKYQKYEKDVESDAQIRRAIEENEFLKNLMDEERLQAVVEAMQSEELTAGSFIIREGDAGSHLYVSAEGRFQVIKGNSVVKEFGAGVAFGELAILYKATRFASVKVSTNAKVWSLERRVFQKIIIKSGRQEQEDNVRFLSSVPVLQGIHAIELAILSDFLKREFFATGTTIVRQGDRGDMFYIIRGGTVTITKRDEDGHEERIGKLSRGDYFGEQALLHEDRRLATVTANEPGVECLTLDRVPFTKFLGNLDELKSIRHTQRSSDIANKKIIDSEYAQIGLQDLEIVGTLGVGGFGRVELVQYRNDRNKTFALKCLKKIEMVQQQQQEHAYNEKHIMIKCDNPFICRLYNTYKDSKYIYFLMEAVLGGDLWTILQKHKHFNEQTARFMAACVIEAFGYLHSRDMIYRDLKPENLMLGADGYVKLVDFGFAKQLTGGSKTYTFAGTPEYVAPEVILNKGHDRAVDYWALGIFVHELLAGKPPFRGADPMKTYTLILKGLDSVQLPQKIGKSAQLLIRKLCRQNPTDRLGYLKNGIMDIKNHKWYLGFDWTSLKEKRMKAPLRRPINSNTDLTNFGRYQKDKLPPDENSGWDVDF